MKKSGHTIEQIDQPEVIEPIDEEEAFDLIGGLFDSLEDDSQPLQVLPRKIDRQYKTTDKVTRSLPKASMDGKELALRMEPKGAPVPVTTKFSLTYKGVDIKSRKQFDSIDQEVYDAIVSIYINSYTSYPGEPIVFTAKNVWTTMTGKDSASTKVTEGQLQMIEESIDKLAYSQLDIDLTEEVENFSYHFDVSDAKLSGNMLNVEKLKFRIGGSTLRGYRLLRKPILLSYAQPKKQIASIPMEVLNTPVNKGKRILMLQSYLLRRIIAMKGSGKLSRTILYDTIYKTLDEEEEDRRRKGELRKYTEEILQYWSDIHYIEGFKEVRRGRKIHGIQVELKEARYQERTLF